MRFRHKPLLVLLLIGLYQVLFSPCTCGSSQDDGGNIEALRSPAKVNIGGGSPVKEATINKRELYKQLAEKVAKLKELQYESYTIRDEANRLRYREERGRDERLKELNRGTLHPYLQRAETLRKKHQELYKKYLKASEKMVRDMRNLDKKIKKGKNKERWEKQLEEKRKEYFALSDDYKIKSEPIWKEQSAQRAFINAIRLMMSEPHQQAYKKKYEKVDEIGIIINSLEREISSLRLKLRERSLHYSGAVNISRGDEK